VGVQPHPLKQTRPLCPEPVYRPRLELIAALSERFEHIRLGTLDQDQIDRHFAEPGRYERWMGVTIPQTKVQYSDPDPTIIICHLHASIDQLGKRKRHGDIRTQTATPGGARRILSGKYVGEDEWHRERDGMTNDKLDLPA